ncbi:anti-sigma factor family protein [Humisphaera borealis]|uniref:Anti-sigma factor n=1 Tax=Humisphaera borealis TaxID=2807512 RepID=A0A7M2X2K4_9BACT|nr:hypothetical protein [Humisphaera borealis]QOV91652.1 hypothetical protein IPV69_09925 [Humisphaera borealis]
MPDPTDNLDATQRLMAFADGELNAAQQLEAMRAVAADTDAAKVVEQEIRLRQAVARTLSAGPGPSEALQRSVAALAFQMPAATTAEPSSVARRWVPLGVAAAIALLAGGTLIGRFALQPDRPTIATHPDRDVLPANYIAAATQIHVRCSRGVEHHPHGGWPKTLVSIEEPVKQYVNNNSQHYPDLSSIGFKYLGCGPCGRPEETGVHLLYRSTAGTDTLSLFIEPFTNQVDLAPGTCCYSRTSDVHPVLVWRTQNLVFFMVGNAKAAVESARTAMKLPEPI